MIINKKKKINKKLQEAIEKFNYYHSQILPQARSSYKPQFDYAIQLAHINYYFKHLSIDWIADHSFVNQEILLSSVIKAYLQDGMTKLKENCYLRKNQQKKRRQMIQFIAIDTGMLSMTNKPNRQKCYDNNGLINESRNELVYKIYVIHFSEQNDNKEQNFVEELSFVCNNNPTITYRLSYALSKSSSFLLFFFDQFKLSPFIKEYIMGIQTKLKNLNSIIYGHIKQIKNLQAKQIQNCHLEFKREKNLPVDQLINFQNLKKQIYCYFVQKNKHRKLNKYFLDNLICRFMQFKKYDYKQSLKSVQEYILYQKHMRESYTYESFKHYHSQLIFEYIGKDFAGRPIIYNRPYMVDPSKFISDDEFMDYNMYFMDIFLQDQMQGYIDQFILIGDYGKYSSANLKFSIVSKASQTVAKYMPNRQFKVISFNLGIFTYNVYRLVKPFIPKFIMDKMQIFGTDLQPMKKYLSQIMDINQLPSHIFNSSVEDEAMKIQSLHRPKI